MSKLKVIILTFLLMIMVAITVYEFWVNAFPYNEKLDRQAEIMKKEQMQRLKWMKEERQD